MKENFHCIICNGSSYSKINSYKHHWLSCNDCGNIVRKRKKRYLIPLILPSWLAKLFLPASGVKKLFPVQEVIEEDVHQYDYYNEASGLSVSGTKWEGESEQHTKTLEKYGINVAGKKILDISGGPGFVVKELQSIAEKAVATEFSPVAVEGMIKNLGIEAVKFDYQTDKLSEVLDEKFDIVFINFSINFCNDLKKFVHDLKSILKKDSVVYVSFVPPTLGCCLRWHHDEYTYNILYQPETMGRIFAEEGFSTIEKKVTRTFGVVENRSFAKKLFFLPFNIPYAVWNLRPFLSINRELIQKDLLHIYKYDNTD